MNDLSNILGPEPNWKRCDCGELSSRVPCWDCDRRSTQRADEARELLTQIVPRRFAGLTLTDPSLRQIVKLKVKESLDVVARRVIASDFVVFAGPSGLGKTTLACACVKERRPRGLYVSAPELGVARIQHPAGRGEAPLVEQAMATPLLLLDELGGESKTVNNAVKDVVFKRYDDKLPIWVTTGFTSTELVGFYGDGIVRRFTEHALIVRFEQ